MATTNPKSIVRQFFPTAHRILLERSLRRVSGRFNRVLVVGAGSDPYAQYFSGREIYVRVDSVRHQGATDVIGDACALPFRADVFDCVVATEVLEHLRDPAKFVSEAYRVLRADGRLILTVPFMYHIHGDPDDYHRFTESGLRRLLNCFDTVAVYGFGSRLHVIWDLLLTSRIVRYPLFPLRLLSYLFAIFAPARGSYSTAPSGYLCVACLGARSS